jgi:eukaryotic-like serine/threonine-protein kinase
VRPREEAKAVHDGTVAFVPTCVALSGDGQWLAVAGERAVCIIALATQAAVLDVRDAHAGTITAVAWSPDSAWVATASVDRTVRLWRPRL